MRNEIDLFPISGLIDLPPAPPARGEGKRSRGNRGMETDIRAVWARFKGRFAPHPPGVRRPPVQPPAGA